MGRILFEIVAEDVGVSKRLDALRQTIKYLKKEISGAAAGSAEYTKLTNEIAGAKVEVNKLTESQRQLNREFKAAQLPTDSLAGLRLQYSAVTEQITKLSAAQRESDFGKQLIQQAANYKREINGIEESLGRFTGSVGNYKKALVSIGDLVTAGLLTGGITAAVTAVSNVVSKGVDSLGEYESQLDNLQSITGVTAVELEKFRVKAEELTNIKLGDSDLVNSPQKIFEGFKLVGSAQPELLKSAEALQQVTKDAIVLAAASGDTLPASVTALTTVLGQFQLAGSESTRVVNELAAGAKVGASEIPQTTDALQKFGTTAKVANVSTAESIALIQTLADQQLKGAEAGTQLRNILVKISAADALPRNAIAAFEAANVNVNILKDSTLPLQTRLAELGKLAGDTGGLVKVFGVENLTAAQILTQNVTKFADFTTAIEGTNEAYKQAEINTSNLKTQLSNLKTTGVNTLTDAFKTLSPAIQFVIDVVARGFGIFNSFLGVLREIPQFINDNKVALFGLATGVAILNGNMILAAANTLRLAAAQRIQTIITTATTLAQTGLNAAMRANPIGLIITLVSALVIAFQEAYKRSETFRASINGLGALVSEVFTIVKEAITAFVGGFEKLFEGDFSGALDSFGDALVKSNPIGIALTQGDRLGKAFSKGYNDTLANVNEPNTAPAENAIKGLADVVTQTNNVTAAEAKKLQEQQEAAAKATEEQTVRIKQSLEELRQLERDAITNDFDKQIADAAEKRLDAIQKVEERKAALDAKIKSQSGGQTSGDLTEAGIIEKETAAIEAAYTRQIGIIEKNRAKAFETQQRELQKALANIQSLATQNAERVVQIDSQIAAVAFAEQIRAIKENQEQKEAALRESLIAGDITQRQFDKESETLKAETNARLLAADLERLERVKEITQQITDAKVAAAQTQLNAELFAIDSATRAEIEALKERQTATGVDATALIEAKQAEAIEKRTAAQNEFNKTVLDATKQQTDAIVAATAEVTDAEKVATESKLKDLEDEKDLREEIQKAALSAASTVSGAIFEISRNRADQEKEAELAALDETYSKKLEAAQGNATLEAKIKKELEAKKAAVEKEAAQKRKRSALIEAGINTALAITKALTGAAPPVSFILAALAAIAGAAQIAVISSQTFARGGVAKSGTFGGRSHAMGGTRGYFDDGTQIEVEADEDFIILNKRASAERRRLSNLNQRFGGKKFAAGGVVDFTPQIAIPSGGSGSNLTITANAQFTDDQVNDLGSNMGAIISATVAVEVRSALADGLNDANRRLERETTLQEQRNV